jgi:predicted RNase H-like nuclease (RuvC/YqgF family)
MQAHNFGEYQSEVETLRQENQQLLHNLTQSELYIEELNRKLQNEDERDLDEHRNAHRSEQQYETLETTVKEQGRNVDMIFERLQGMESKYDKMMQLLDSLSEKVEEVKPKYICLT